MKPKKIRRAINKLLSFEKNLREELKDNKIEPSKYWTDLTQQAIDYGINNIVFFFPTKSLFEIKYDNSIRTFFLDMSYRLIETLNKNRKEFISKEWSDEDGVPYSYKQTNPTKKLLIDWRIELK